MKKDLDLLLNPFCAPEMLDELEDSFIKEIAPDVWYFEGYLGLDFFQKPASSNVFILRDGDLVFLFDTGALPFYRERILKQLRKYSSQGAKTLVMMVSQGHWDHILNNGIILEAGFENVRFLLPEPEKAVINLPYHFINSGRAMDYYVKDSFGEMGFGLKILEELARKYPAYSDPYYKVAWDAIRALPEKATTEQTRHAFLLYITRIMVRDYNNMSAWAEHLPLDSRQNKWIGPAQFDGWQVGRFFAIHDASHSPGHVCLYDPLNKLMLTGDATVEINPPFLDGSMNRLIDITTKCRIMAEQGLIELAADAHRQATRYPGKERLKMMGVDLLDPIQETTLAKGRKECVAFYSLYENYFRDLVSETESAHRAIGEATVEEIVEKLGKSSNKNVQYKFSMRLPHTPSFPTTLVANILMESHAPRRVVDGRILFNPVPQWKF